MTLTSNTNKLIITLPTDLVIVDPCYIFDHTASKILDSVWLQMCDEWFPSTINPSPHANCGTITYLNTQLLYTSAWRRCVHTRSPRRNYYPCGC